MAGCTTSKVKHNAGLSSVPPSASASAPDLQHPDIPTPAPVSLQLLTSCLPTVLVSCSQVQKLPQFPQKTPQQRLSNTHGSLTSTLRRSGKIRKRTVEETPGGGRRRREETDRGWVCGRGGNQTWCFSDQRWRYWGTQCVCGQPGCVCGSLCVWRTKWGGVGGLCCQRQLKLHWRLTAANTPSPPPKTCLLRWLWRSPSPCWRRRCVG